MIEYETKKIIIEPKQTRAHKTHKRKKSARVIKLSIIILLIAAALFVVIAGAKKIIGLKPAADTAQNTDIDETLPYKTAAANASETEVEADAPSEKTGVTRSELRKELMDEYKWNMTATFAGGGQTTFNISNLIEDDIDRLLDEIYDGEVKSDYKLEFEAGDKELDVELTVMKSLWEKKPSSSLIVAYDTATDEFELGGGTNGIKLNEEKLREDIKTAVKDGDFDRVIEVEYEEVLPNADYESAKSLYTVIGSFTTHSTDNENRNTNLNLACNAINGTILQPGEEFSFNLKTGLRSAEKGYKAAGAYNAGQTVQEEGGGVCQVSTTLYNALMKSGLRATERHAHTYEPSYVTPGEDAMVSYDGYSGPDLKFTNTTNSSIVIKASYWDRTVMCTIIGAPILGSGTKVEMHSTRVMTQDPVVVYEEDPTIAPGTTVIASNGTGASRWETYVRVTVNGQVISDELLHTSAYDGHQRIIKRNSLPVVEIPVIPEEGQIPFGPGMGPGTGPGATTTPAVTDTPEIPTSPDGENEEEPEEHTEETQAPTTAATEEEPPHTGGPGHGTDDEAE